MENLIMKQWSGINGFGFNFAHNFAQIIVCHTIADVIMLNSDRDLARDTFFLIVADAELGFLVDPSCISDEAASINFLEATGFATKTDEHSTLNYL